MPRMWRLITTDAPETGAWNMAVDRALLMSSARGGPPTLRVYRWAAPTASLGRFQPATDADVAVCARFGIDVVRRPTGGRGVLHDDEVTYSVTARAADGVPRSVRASYAFIGAAIARAYGLLGVPAELVGAHRGRRGSAACYLAATQADLSLAGAKLSGSAQVWEGGACLQHGSFVLSRDVAREAAVFRLPPDAAEELAARTATLADALGVRPAVRDVTAAVAAGFADGLGVRLECGALTLDELRGARALVESFAVAQAAGGTLRV